MLQNLRVFFILMSSSGSADGLQSQPNQIANFPDFVKMKRRQMSDKIISRSLGPWNLEKQHSEYHEDRQIRIEKIQNLLKTNFREFCPFLKIPQSRSAAASITLKFP